MQNQETQENQQIVKPIKFLFIGRTGAGKTVIAHAVCEKLGLKQVKSLTTRLPRNENEKNNSWDHYFVSNEEFDSIGNREGFAAYTEINGNRYATTFDELDKSDVYVIDPAGVKNLKESCGDQYKFIEIYIRVPYRLNEQRFIDRGGTKQEFKSRYDDESVQFAEYEKEQMFDYHLLNDKPLDESVDIVCEWIKKETLVLSVLYCK